MLNIGFDYPSSHPIIAKESIKGCKFEEVQAYPYGICSKVSETRE